MLSPRFFVPMTVRLLFPAKCSKVVLFDNKLYNTNIQIQIIMKKWLLTLVLSSMAAVSLNAQNFVTGSSQMNLLVGLESSTDVTRVPPLAVNYEYGLVDWAQYGTLGVGGVLGYTSHGDKTYNTSLFLVGATCAYHYELSFLPQLELYTGFMLYYNNKFMNYSTSYLDKSDSYSSGFDASLYLGAKYFFTDRIGANLQLGGMATFNIGLAVRL